MYFPSRRAIDNDSFAFACGASATDLFCVRSIPNKLEQQRHEDGAQDGSAQDANHHQVAFAVLLWPRLPIRCPSAVESIGREDRPKIAEARHQSGGGSNADFTVSGLEDLVRPGHGDGYGRAQSEADHQQTAIARPWVRLGACVGRHEKTSDLDTDGGDEKESAVVMEAVRDWGNEEDGNKIHLTRSATALSV